MDEVIEGLVLAEALSHVFFPHSVFQLHRQMRPQSACAHTAMAMRGTTGIKLHNMIKADAHLQTYVAEYIKKRDETLFDWRA